MRIRPGRPGPEEAAPGVTWKKAMVLANKLDMVGPAGAADSILQALAAEHGGRLPVLAISARRGTGLEELRRAVFDLLEIIRVYTKSPGQKPDLEDPIVLPRGATLADAAEDVHKDFRAKLKFARLWGSGKHDGIMVKRDHVLEDGDIIELHL